MPLKKLKDPTWPPPCHHPEHKPPSHMAPPPGVYEYTCPACGARYVFVVGQKTWLGLA